MGIEKLKEFWPEWEIGDVLGKGSFGRVYKASNRSSGVTSLSAIKVITIPNDEAEYDALLNEGMSISDTKEYFRDIVNEFINEIKVMVALKGAPNIVAVEDYKILESKERVGWDIFIRMELLHSFKEFLNSHTPAESEIVKMGIDIANALEICQQKNIIHRDIKPANIFMDDYGSFKLGDFGIAKELEKTTGAASSKGTFTFMAPEVAHGQRYDNTVDIYSLGLVMYTILNGNRAPFVPANGRVTYNDRKAANDRRLAGEALPPIKGISDELNNIILSACSYDPGRRFKSATAFKNALKSLKYTSKAAPTPKTEPTVDKAVALPKKGEKSSKPEDKKEIDATVAVAHKAKSTVIPEAKEKTEKPKKGGIIAVAILLVLAIAAAVIVPDYLPKGAISDEPDTNTETESIGVLGVGDVVPDYLPKGAISDEPDTNTGTESIGVLGVGDVVPDYSADTHQINSPAPKVNKVVNANEMAMYNAIFYDKDESYMNTDMTKTGIFIIFYDAFYGRERYYVWGYDDDSADSSWQWEFTVADPSTLPKVGSEVTVTGKFVANDNALDKKWIENAAVIVVSEYNNALCKYDLTIMGPIMSGRVQIPNIQSHLDEFNDKIALYAKVAENGILSSVYENIPWSVHTTYGTDLPDVGTIVTVVGTFDEHGNFMIETLYIEE